MENLVMKPMIEHPTTVKVLREEYDRKVRGWLGETCMNYIGEEGRVVLETIDRCTTLQLHSLCKLIDRNPPNLKVLRCNPTDHLAVTFANMYVGIEVDGYTHS